MTMKRPIGLLSIVLLGMLGCSSGGGSNSPTDPTDPTDPNGGGLPTTTNTVTITSSGGAVELQDGTSVVFPAGAVSSDLPVT